MDEKERMNTGQEQSMEKCFHIPYKKEVVHLRACIVRPNLPLIAQIYRRKVNNQNLIRWKKFKNEVVNKIKQEAGHTNR